MNTDNDIQKDIIAALKWEPSLRDDDIAVGVRDGIVTLGGFVDSFADKNKVERVVGRVKEVKAIVNEIEVTLPTVSERADPDIARAALDALTWSIAVPHERLRVKVEHGWVSIEGEVDWFYQKEAADRAIRYLTGVKGLSNLITLRARPTPTDVQRRIKEALQRTADIDAGRITVEIEGNTAVLHGSVRSYAELRDAERAARNAPGITDVRSQLAIAGTYAAV